MSDLRALEGVRIGCVPYLNAKPLLGAPATMLASLNLVFDHPARLAAELSAGRLDIALVPTFELLAHPQYRVVDGVSISSRGPVFSVFLAYRGALADLREVSLDAASLTSANLLRCLLAEFHGLRPHWATRDADARLLIGDQAIAFRRGQGDAFSYLDLGEEWARCVGLPFVYAMWLIRRDVPDARVIGDALRAVKAHGIHHLPEIVAAESEWSAAFRERYLTEHIRYDLGGEEKRGIKRYREMLVKHGLIGHQHAALEYV